MKICAVQMGSMAGDVLRNIDKHLHFIEFAAAQGGELTFFPELSLTGYEPNLAESLATSMMDGRFDVIQRWSDVHHMAIGVGMPISGPAGIQIGMIWFTPNSPRRLYAKQQLHSDEDPIFTPGDSQLILDISGTLVAPAICYESLQMSHADTVGSLGSTIYLASVAKPIKNVSQAMAHYPAVALKHGMLVVMANSIGPSDNFVSAGQSAAWNTHSEMIAKMGADSEGLLVLDTIHETGAMHELEST